MQGQRDGHPFPLQPAPQVIYIQTAPPTSKVYENYAANTSRSLGLARILIGVFSIVFQITLIVIEAEYYGDIVVSPVGSGIWCGVMFIVAGSFGIGAAVTKTRCMIVTNMVMAIVSVSICGTSYVAVSAAGISMSANKGNYIYGYSHIGLWNGILSLYCVTLILALAQVVCDIWSAVICCKAVCCGRPATQMNTQVAYSQGQAYPVQHQQQQDQQGQIYQFQQQHSVAYNPQPTYQYPFQTASGNTTPPPAYTQQEQKRQPQGFAA